MNHLTCLEYGTLHHVVNKITKWEKKMWETSPIKGNALKLGKKLYNILQ